MKKIKIIYADGYEWAKNNCNRKFDIIIIDSTDPVGFAKKLFTKRFFGYTFGMLNSGGIYIQQSGSPIIHYEKIIQPMIKQLSVIGFKKITINPFSMPSYPLGILSFLVMLLQPQDLCLRLIATTIQSSKSWLVTIPMGPQP